MRDGLFGVRHGLHRLDGHVALYLALRFTELAEVGQWFTGNRAG